MKNASFCSGRFRDLSSLNKAPAPWTHVASLGEFPGQINIPAGYSVPGYGDVEEDRSVEGITVFNEDVFESIIKGFSGEVLIDADHLSHDSTQPTEALGWGVELRRAAGGQALELKTPWTPPGVEKITTQVYRYISPEFTGAVRFENGVFKFYPSALVGAGLTNRPKLTNLRPVSANRSRPEISGKSQASLLCRLLGIPEAAKPHEIEAKAGDFISEVDRLRQRAARADELEIENKSLRDEMIDTDLETYKDVIGDVESTRELLQINRATTVKSLAAQLARKGGNAPQPLYQRNRATPPDGRKFFDADDTAKASEQRELIATIQNRDRCVFSEAWERAKREKPHLFAR